MGRQSQKGKILKFFHAKRGIALPVTFLMLFVSLVVLISITYYFSVIKISAKSLELKASGVEQEMLSLEKVAGFVSWSPGAYEIFEFGDYGGKFKVAPDAKSLVLNITDNSSLQDVFFNGGVGKVVYELPSTQIQDNLFLKGDNRVIANQSSSTMSQLAISQGFEHYEMTLSYRPLAGSTVTGESSGKPVNSVRVYIISLNSSESLTRLGSFRVKVSCVNVESSWRSYSFSDPVTALSVKAGLDGDFGEVSLPVSSSALGAIVNLETVICSLKIEDAGW